MFLMLYLQTPATGYFTSQELYKINHLFGPGLVVSTLATNYNKAQVNNAPNQGDICGNVWFASIPDDYGLASATGETSCKTDLYNVAFLPQNFYDTNKSGQTNYKEDFFDLTSAAPILFGTDMNSLAYKGVSTGSYWTKATKGKDGKIDFDMVTLEDVESFVTYPQLDFSHCYELAAQSWKGTQGSAVDGSAVGLNYTNVDSLFHSYTKPFTNPGVNKINIDNKFSGSDNKNRKLNALVNMISDCSSTSIAVGATTFTPYPHLSDAGSWIIQQGSNTNTYGSPYQQNTDFISQISRDTSAIDMCGAGVSVDGQINKYTQDMCGGVFQGFVGVNDGQLTTAGGVTYDANTANASWYANVSSDNFGSFGQQAASITLGYYNYNEQLLQQTRQIITQIQPMEWYDLYDICGLGLNQIIANIEHEGDSVPEVGSDHHNTDSDERKKRKDQHMTARQALFNLRKSVAPAVKAGQETDEAFHRFTQSQGTQGSKGMWSTDPAVTTRLIGHNVQQGLLDQVMRQPATEIVPALGVSANIHGGKLTDSRLAKIPAPYTGGHFAQDSTGKYVFDMSAALVYLRVKTCADMGVDLSTFLYWNQNTPLTSDSLYPNAGQLHVNDMSSATYNFASMVRGISGGQLKQAFNAAGTTYGTSASMVGPFVDFSSAEALDLYHGETVRQSPADIPWLYTEVVKTVYPDSKVFEEISIYNIVTHMGQDMAVWTNATNTGIYERMDMCLNNTGSNPPAESLVYATSSLNESTCKAGDVLPVFANLNLFASQSNTTAYEKYLDIWNDISARGFVQNNSSTNITSLNATTGAKAAVSLIAYDSMVTLAKETDSANTLTGGASFSDTNVSYPTQLELQQLNLMSNLVPVSDIQSYAKCPGITDADVNAVLDVHKKRFQPVPHAALTGGHTEASGLLIASSSVLGLTALDASLCAQGFSIVDMSMCLLIKSYEAVFNQLSTPPSKVDIVNKLLLDNFNNTSPLQEDMKTDQYDTSTNAIIDSMLDCGVTVDEVVQLYPGDWNDGAQIGDTVGVYATASQTSLGRSKAIADAFASHPLIGAQFFDDISLNSDISYATSQTSSDGNPTMPNDQAKADMIDFLLWFDVDQDKIWNMLGANEYTRTYWLKNWFTNTRQTDMSYSQIGTNTSTASGVGLSTAGNGASPQSYIMGASKLIQHVPVVSWANDPNYGVSYPGWGTYKATNPSWMLAYAPAQLKAAGVACQGVITSCITSGYIIDGETLAVESTLKCAFSQSDLKKTGPNGEPGYTQKEINDAIGQF
jgi:hypothetical protein